MSTTAGEALLDGWERAWSGRDGSAFAEVCAADIHYEDPVLDQPIESLDGVAAHATRLWAAFPDARMEATAQRLWSPDGRFGCAPVKLLATHKDELAGLPATGRFLVLHAVFYVELDEGRERLLRVRGFFDRYDAAVQLGVMPARGTMGERALLMLRGFGWSRGTD